MPPSSPRKPPLSRYAVLVLFLSMAANACSRDTTEIQDRLPPPTLVLTGSSRVVIVGASDTSLEVSAHLYNPTSVPLRVDTGPDCPLAVSLVSDSTAQNIVNIDVQECPSTASTVDVAPGDSTTLVRVLPPSALSSYASGVYDVNVGVASSAALMGAWAGTVRLPLAPGP
jgi:hypothetical protein